MTVQTDKLNRKSSMNPISDELIMAYVDGEVDQKQADIIDKALENNPGLRVRANMFKDTKAMLEGLYDEPLHDEVPERLLNTVRTYRPPVKFRDLIIQFFQNYLRFPEFQPVPVSAFIAVMLISTGLIYYINSASVPGNNTSTGLTASKEFCIALEKTPGGQSVFLQQYRAEIVPVATFQDKKSRFCRQFEVLAGTSDMQSYSEGIACRTTAGTWETVAFKNVPATSPQQPTDSNYELAGNDGPIDEVREQLRAGPLLSSAQESELISRAWENNKGTTDLQDKQGSEAQRNENVR